MKDEEKERRRQDIRLTLAPVGQAAGILALFVIAFLIPFVFILKANVLGFVYNAKPASRKSYKKNSKYYYYEYR